MELTMAGRKVKKGRPIAKVAGPTKKRRSAKRRKPKIVFMDLMMPNGRALKDNSLEDIEQLIQFFTSLAAGMRERT